MRFGKGMVRAHTRRVKGKTVFVPAHRRIDHGTLPRARMKNSANMATTPEELASRFGPESERFQLRDKDDKPLLVRKFGRGKNHAFAVHDADGSHIATMHVKAHKDGARVTAGWTHDKHNRRGVHNSLLHRLVSHHGTVTSPTSMHYDLHHAFNTMDDDHELSTERTEGGGGVRYRLQRKQMTLFKGRVKAHWRKLPSGKTVRVQEYTNKRTEKAPPAKAPKAAAAASVPYSVRVAPGREHEVTPADAHAVNRHLQVALDWIARAHNLPKLDITVQYGPMGAQEPGMTAAEYDRDRRTMLLSHDAPSTIVHEMAHAIDHQVLGVNRTFGTERWEQWVDQDRAMPSNLQGLSAVMDALAPQSWQKRIREFVDTLPDTDADYVARPSEVFARAYEQYVYTKAARKPADNIDEGRLMLFGRMVRTQALVDKGLYWTDEEFGAIEQAFDRLFAGGGIAKAFCRFVECSVDLFKGRVKAHWRKLPSGKIVRVQEYTNKRTKKPQQAPARPESIQKTKEQIAEDSFTYGSGIFWRVHSKGKPLDPNAESWPWGMSREEAEELDLVLPGVSCMSNPEELVGYWEARGGVDDNLGEVVVFSGRLLDVPDEGDVAVPERELFRIPYSRVKAAVDADDYSLLDAPPPSTASGSLPTRRRRWKHVRDHR